MFELSGLRNLVKTVCAIDRLRLWKDWYHCVFLVHVVVWSPSVTSLALHKDVRIFAAPPYPQNSY